MLSECFYFMFFIWYSKNVVFICDLNMQKLKSRLFKDLYPQILELKMEGYTDKQVITLLKEKYQLELTYGTFLNYLHINKKNNPIATSTTTENPILEKKAVLPVTTNKLQNTVLETKQPIQKIESKCDNSQNIDSTEQPVKKRLTLADIQNEKTEEELRDERIRNVTKQYLK